MAISSGSYTVGSGGNYATWAPALADLSLPLTGDLTFTQISDTIDTAIVTVSGDLGGYTLTFDSSVPHEGIYGGGNVTYIRGTANSGLQVTFQNGTVEIKNLEFRADEDLVTWLLKISALGSTVAKVHDIIITADSSNRSKGFVAEFRALVDAQYEIWNMIVDVVIGTVTSKSALYATLDSTSSMTVENCTIRTTSDSANRAVRTEGTGAGVSYAFRNVYAIFAGTGGGEAFSDNGNAGGVQRNCASSDDSADAFTDALAAQKNIALGSQFFSMDPTSGADYVTPIPQTIISDTGTTPQIAENTVDLRGTSRTGTSIGSIQVLIVPVGIGVATTSFDAEPTEEGPQILVRWNLPSSPFSHDFKLLRKETNYPDDETDGAELISTTVSAAPDHYVDLGPAIETVWCYSSFVWHSCGRPWVADEFVESGTTVIPTTPDGFFYESNSRGLTGSTEPTWPAIIGSTVQDGDLIWICRGTNPGWISGKDSRDAAFTWNSEYMQRLLFTVVPEVYRNEDASSTLTRLDTQQDSDDYDVWRAIHEDGTTQRGDFERFLLILGTMLARIRGAADFYPRAVDPDETLPQLLPFLAGILGWELSTTFPTGKQRQDIMSAVPIYKIKGTIGSLEPSLRQAVGVDDVFVDPMSRHIMLSNRTTRLSAQGQVAGTYSSWVLSTAYARGDIVIPTGVNRTGFYYQVRTAGTSAGSEPTWPTVPGDEVADNTVVWRTVQFGVPHLTADASGGAGTLTVDDTSPFEAGETINVRDSTTPSGEEIIVSAIPDSTTLTLDGTLVNSYTLQDNAVASPAYDWYDDETGFIWDVPLIDQFDGIDPDRVRVPGAVIEPSLIYSFEILRIWIILAAGESVSNIELENVEKFMTQFAPADTSYVVRIEGP